jgi:Family of unknown function (DUF6194)
MRPMKAAEAAAYIDTFAAIERTEAYGYTMFFYGTLRMLPFATILEHDTEYDSGSNLDARGAWRLNIGIEKATYKALVLDPDPHALDRLQPHPHYAAQAWISIISPSQAMFTQTIAPLLVEAHALAKRRDQR